MCQELSYFLEDRIYISLVWVLNWNKLFSEEAQVNTTQNKRALQLWSHSNLRLTAFFHCWVCCIYWIRVKLLPSYSGLKDGRQISTLRASGSRETTTMQKKILHMEVLENTRVCRTLPFLWRNGCRCDDYFLSWSNPFYGSTSTWHTRWIWVILPRPRHGTALPCHHMEKRWKKGSSLTPQGLGTSNTQDRNIHSWS